MKKFNYGNLSVFYQCNVFIALVKTLTIIMVVIQCDDNVKKFLTNQLSNSYLLFLEINNKIEYNFKFLKFFDIRRDICNSGILNHLLVIYSSASQGM